jgi:alkanesulfonate monooxygenase SsuD/methylene tetrahydromethanopterin reductase-like flavin-dependent oxidoreductase (luciferase family)
LRFGLAYDLLTADAGAPLATGEITRHARLAENLGFDSIWAGESHQRVLAHGHLPSPLLGLAAIAAVTNKIRLGTGVLLLPLYDPHRLAEDTAVLDCLSSGRLILGLALGGVPNRKAYNIPRGESTKLFEEALTVLKKLWSETEVSFAGAHFTCEQVSIVPRPLQEGGPPILIGGGTPAWAARAARLAAGWIGASNYGRTLLKELIGHYRGALEGKRSGFVAVNRVIYIARDDSTAEESGVPFFKDFANWYLSRGALKTGRTISSLDGEESLRSAMSDLAIIGSPDTCIKTIEEYEEIGVDQLNLRVRLPDMTSNQTEDAMKLIAERVFPHFPKEH